MAPQKYYHIVRISFQNIFSVLVVCVWWKQHKETVLIFLFYAFDLRCSAAKEIFVFQPCEGSIKLMNTIGRKPSRLGTRFSSHSPIRKPELGLRVGKVVCDAQGPGNESRSRKG